jgi:hypothetical protein
MSLRTKYWGGRGGRGSAGVDHCLHREGGQDALAPDCCWEWGVGSVLDTDAKCKDDGRVYWLEGVDGAQL